MFALNDHFLHKESLLGFSFQIAILFMKHFVVTVIAYLVELVGGLLLSFLPEMVHTNDVLTKLTKYPS